MICREKCGACCIAPSISSPLPGMPQGKPAGIPCVNLDTTDYRCRIWGTTQYPDVCARFRPQADTCGASRSEAEQLTTLMELQTS
ncbi:YkgJ family cysteine cluster protein [Congregibacter sp.]|uniref:YkgJ family cysteine cluster protein n=1 Tax=Congregibacter sp. TaxID=2744308 RepID=UPI0039E21823